MKIMKGWEKFLPRIPCHVNSSFVIDFTGCLCLTLKQRFFMKVSSARAVSAVVSAAAAGDSECLLTTTFSENAKDGKGISFSSV
ncbi:MAG: hypothetical protein V2I33_24385 [Kangiellaceae bacterium]|nr:hypothetical protein [Kangiellaceae bacterium]